MKTIARIISALVVLGLFLCDEGSLSAYAQDPSLPGPFAVTREEYDFGDTAFTPPGFPGPVEVRGSVHYPTNWTGAPLPLILFLHGRHGVCFQGSSGGPFQFQWPCPTPNLPIPSYTGYDYISQVLAPASAVPARPVDLEAASHRAQPVLFGHRVESTDDRMECRYSDTDP